MYVLYSKNFHRYYVCQCEDLALRLARYNGKAVPSTKVYVPWKMVHTEWFTSRADALKRETEIKKKKSRKYIEYLISDLTIHSISSSSIAAGLPCMNCLERYNLHNNLLPPY